MPLIYSKFALIICHNYNYGVIIMVETWAYLGRANNFLSRAYYSCLFFGFDVIFILKPSEFIGVKIFIVR